MKQILTLSFSSATAVLLAACASTPETIDELVTARSVVAQVEASPRAGVAATSISDARNALERANELAEEGGSLEDIKYHANVAATNAQIANEKIVTAQAREEIDKAEAERQAVLLEARERQAQRHAERARSATERAESATARAESLEQRAGELREQLADLKAKETDRGFVVTLGDVLFATDEATLKPGAYSTIDRLANLLKESADRKILIEGHTDSVGTAEYNQQLSEQRAAAVQAALLERGVAATQIRTVGRGESTPIASNNNPGGRQQNRRVEVVFQGAAMASDGG